MSAGRTGPRPRLAIAIPNLGPGGAERVVLTLAGEFCKRGFDVDLVLLKAEGALLPLVPAGVNLVVLGARHITTGLLPLVRYLRRRRPVALQVHMWPFTLLGIIAVALARTRTRVIVVEHTTLSRQLAPYPRHLRAAGVTMKALYPAADARIAVSEGAADDLAQLAGMPRQAFAVVHNPVPAVQPQSGGEVDRLWGDARYRIVSAGTLKPVKNLALLISAFAMVPKDRQAKLMILGDGALRDTLETHARRLGVAGETIFAGFRPDPLPLMASADLFVLSSDHEGFPTVLIEALRLGLTIVSTDCPSGPCEILDGGRFGALVPCGDAAALAAAMARALDEPAPPERQKGRAEALSGMHTVDRHLALMLGQDWAPAGQEEHK